MPSSSEEKHMNQIVSDVLKDFRERLATDDRVEGALAESLVDRLSQERVPNADSIVEVIRQGIEGTSQ